MTYHDVSICSSETEAIDAGPPLAKRPRLLASSDLQAPFIEWYVLVGMLEIVVRKDKAAF